MEEGLCSTSQDSLHPRQNSEWLVWFRCASLPRPNLSGPRLPLSCPGYLFLPSMHRVTHTYSHAGPYPKENIFFSITKLSFCPRRTMLYEDSSRIFFNCFTEAEPYPVFPEMADRSSQSEMISGFEYSSMNWLFTFPPVHLMITCYHFPPVPLPSISQTPQV